MPRHDDDARAALDAFVASRRPDPQRRRHNWNETLARLGEDPLAEPTAARPARRMQVWIGACAAIVVAAIGMGTVLGRRALTEDTREPAAHSQAASIDTTDAAPDAARVRTPEPPMQPRPDREAAPVAPVVPPPEPVAIEREPPRRPKAATPPAAVVAPQPVTITPERLALETDLIARARAAAVAGDDARAVQLLQQHAREHADGAMVEDRRAWLAIVQCRSSSPAGREAAARFAKAHPRSPYAARVREACTVDTQSQ